MKYNTMRYNIKYVFFTALFCACNGLVFAQQNNILTLQQCLDIAVKNNLTVQQDSIAAQQAKIGYLQAKDNLIPYITGAADRELTSGRALNPVTNTYITQSVTSDNYNLNSSVTLFNGLELQKAIKQAALAFQSGKMAFQAAKDIVTVNVITNYLQILDAGEVLKQDTSQFAVAKESLDRSEILEQQGDNKFASDVYDLRGSLQASKVNLVTAQNAYNSAMLSLFNLLNIPYNKDARLQPLNADELKGNYGVNSNQVYNTALEQLAEVKAATLMRQSAEKGVEYARGLLYPQLVLEGGIGTNYSDLNTQSYYNQFRNNYGTYLELGLNIPIFTNHVKKNAVSLAKLNLQNYQYLENNTKIQLKQNVDQAYYNMAAAYNRFQAYTDEVKAYTESFRISKIRYEAGVLTSVDFITSKNNMDAANLGLISAKFDYYIYSKILDYYQGKLTL